MDTVEIICVLLACSLGVQGNQSCSTLGSNQQGSVPSTKPYGLFVNTVDTTSCGGNATSWTVCYYNATSDPVVSSYALFAVYRPVPGSSNYTLITRSTMIYAMSRNTSSYACDVIQIANQFVVLPGDIISAYLSQGRSLGVISNVVGYSVLNAQISSSYWATSIDTSVGYTVQNGQALNVKLALNVSSVSTTSALVPKTSALVPTTSALVSTTSALVSTASASVLTSPSGTFSASSSTALSPTSAYTESSSDDSLTTSAVPTSWNDIPTSSIGSDLVSPTPTSAFNAVGSSRRLPASVIAAIVIILVIVIVIAVTIFGVAISCRTKLKRLRKNYLMLGHSKSIDIQNSSYRSVDMIGGNSLGMEKSTNVQNQQSQYENLDANSCVSLYACIEEEETQNDLADNESPYAVPSSREDELYRQMERQKIKKINRKEIELAEELGRGQFGGVYTATWRSSGGPVTAAVKVMNFCSSQREETVRFLQEAIVMAQFKHRNVIQLYGIVTAEDPIMLVIELAHNKDLRSYLSLLRSNLSQMNQSELCDQLLSFSQQVALGMQYLSTKAFVHRDLAARNVFVTRELVCKIGDFGLSRNLDDENYYVSHGGAIPVKWTAPEAVLYKKYSTASDVWSYGCLLYEIWSVGCKPFERISNTEVIEKVEAGYRLPPSPGCPLVIYQTMIQCWNPEPYSRPKFRDIHLSLTQNQTHVFMIPNEALQSHPQAGVLGGPLAAGEKMYMSLQKTYHTQTLFTT